MAWYFFDTSALVRRYRSSEPGAARVQAICRPSNGHLVAIARVTRVEMASALSRLRREGRLDEPSLQRAWRRFNGHFEAQYHKVEVDPALLDQGARLLFRHRLRAYDAIQLAAALQVRALAGLMTGLHFCTADLAQAEAGEREGLAVELIG